MSKKIAMYFPIVTHYQHGVARGAMRYAREHGPWQFFGAGWMFTPIKDITSWRGDGIITLLSRAIKEEIRILDSTGIPYVDAGETMDHPIMARVCNDPESIARLVAEHFLKNGFRHFAFIGDSRISWSKKRCDHFIHVLARAGFDCRVIEIQNPEEMSDSQRDMLCNILKDLPKPCGIMTCNDTWGASTLGLCASIGIHVPEELAVVGVDNDDIYRELWDPPLSSVQTNHELIGYMAAEVLDGLMHNKMPSEQTMYVPPIELVTRGSSDILAIKDDAVSKVVSYIREHAHRPVHVSDTLQVVPLSRRAMEVRFKKQMGHTIHEELQKQRLQIACRLLKESNAPIASIAKSSGFKSHQRFAAVFKQAMGMSAAAYRQQHTD
jgi:LacI family transcriptional regulator